MYLTIECIYLELLILRLVVSFYRVRTYGIYKRV